MKGVDYVIAQGWADPNRMVAYGWSYGGYMTFWMSTQTDRFKLISPGAGLTNLYSMYSTTDIPAYLGWFFGTPWENEAIYQKLSPIRFAKNVKAKILIMHGANDARVPPTQADEFYKALKDLGKDVTYVRYPRQGHGITETRLAMDRDRRYVCAFTHAVGLTSTTESCKDGVPTADRSRRRRRPAAAAACSKIDAAARVRRRSTTPVGLASSSSTGAADPPHAAARLPLHEHRVDLKDRADHRDDGGQRRARRTSRRRRPRAPRRRRRRRERAPPSPIVRRPRRASAGWRR